MDRDFYMEIKVCHAILKNLGLWPKSEKGNKYEYHLRFMASLLVMISFCNIPQTVKLFELTNNFDEMLETITNCNITMLISVVKSLNFWYYGKALDGLLASMAKNWRDVKTQSERSIMQKNARLSYLASIMVYLATGSAVSSLLILNIYNWAKESQTFREGKLNATDRKRPMYLTSTFPYDVQKTPYYEITWICQFISTLFGASVFTAADSFFLIVVLHLRGQMKNLRGRFKDLLAEAALRGKDCNNLDLSSFVKRHQYLIWFAETIENIFNMQFLGQLLLSILIFCLTGYQIVLIISKGVTSVLEILYAVYYYICFAASLLMYCLVAMILSTESTKFREAAYDSKWYQLAPSNAKLLVPIMIRASRPFELTAGKFVTLSLQLYCSVVKTSGGYLSMLLAMRKRFSN